MSFEKKQFLDYDGLKAYTSKILELISNKADSAVIAEEIENLKSMIGDVSKLGENYKNLVVALLAEAERAKDTENQIVETLTWYNLGEE